MAKKRGDLEHLHMLAACGAETERLKESGGDDKRLVIPEPDGVSHRRVPLREEVLELVSLEVIRDRAITTVLRPPATFPPLRTHFLPLNLLHPNLLIVIAGGNTNAGEENRQEDDRRGRSQPHFRELGLRIFDCWD